MTSYKADIVRPLGLKPADGVLTSGGELKFNCPYCTSRGEINPDTRYRFQIHVSIDSRLGVYYCFRCNVKGRVREGKKFNPGEVLANNRKVRKEEVLAEDPEVLNDLSIPPDFNLVVEGMNAFDYLVSRGVSREDIEFYGIGISSGRILFPDYDAFGNLCYWVTRSYVEGARGPKYLNCNSPGVNRSNKIYNLGRFFRSGSREVVITEGVLSSISAGRNSVAMYGKKVTDEQVEILRNLEVDCYKLALDPDARKESLELAEKLSSKSREVLLVPIPKGEDPNSLGYIEFSKILEKSIIYKLGRVSCKLEFMYAS